MFRFAAVLTLCLLVAFTGVGLLVSREWGWPEYASDELYVVAFNTSTDPVSFVLVNANGNGQEWDLKPDSETFQAVNCSPDGRFIAFINQSGRLYVANRSGLLFERVVEPSPYDIQVNNRGEVVYLMELIIDANESRVLTAPEDREYASPAVSSSGLSLWIRPSTDVVISSEGQILMSLGMSGYPAWLASEDIFTFISPYPSFYAAHQYLVDTITQSVFMFPSETKRGIFSPDGTKRAVGIYDDVSRSQQIFLMDFFSDAPMYPLGHQKHSYSPLCFLTFRPQMLIDER